MNKLKCLFLTVVTLACTSAMAESDSNGTGLFLEPGISYQLSNSNSDYSGALRNSSASTKGFGVLARAGIHVYDRFFVAADARYAILNFTDNANNFSANASSWDIAPVVGLQMADSGARIFVGYVLAGNLDPQSSNGIDPSYGNATGWRVGAGLKIQHISVNIEWQRLHYGTGKLSGSGQSVSGLNYNPEALVASVTFPIDFN